MFCFSLRAQQHALCTSWDMRCAGPAVQRVAGAAIGSWRVARRSQTVPAPAQNVVPLKRRDAFRSVHCVLAGTPKKFLHRPLRKISSKPANSFYAWKDFFFFAWLAASFFLVPKREKHARRRKIFFRPPQRREKGKKKVDPAVFFF